MKASNRKIGPSSPRPVSGAHAHSGFLLRIGTRRGEEPVDSLGIPERFYYWLLAVFSFNIGFFPLMLSFTDFGHELSDPVVRLICLGGVVAAPFYVVFPKSRGYKFMPFMFHALLVFAIVGPLVSQLSIDGLQGPFQVLYLAGPMGAAFYFPLRQAIPYFIASPVALILVSQVTSEPNDLLRALILGCITVASSLMMHFIKRHLVHTVESNRLLSERDALTGTFNLHKFEEQLSVEISRASRSETSFALLEFDLDNFKQVNDLYSHSIGDEVLVATADAIQSVLSAPDVLVRRGGDEFAVIVPNATERDLEGMLELSRARIAYVRHELCPDVTPTASGALVTHQKGETAADLFRRVDEGLHDAKQLAPGRRGEAMPAQFKNVAYNRTPETQSVAELRERRGDTSSVGDDPIYGARKIAWRTAGVASFATTAIVFACVAAGATTVSLSPLTLSLIIAWSFVMSPGIYFMSRRRHQPELHMHMLAVTAFALITVTCTVVSGAALALVETYLLAMLLVTAILAPRAAFSYIAVGMLLYLGVLVVNDSPDLVLRQVNTLTIVGLLGLVLSFVRTRTIIAARAKAKLARTDALTALPNKRRLMDRLSGEVRRCEVGNGKLALLMMDLDQFKMVNDRYSHAVGDRVLVAVAKAITSSARHADMPARRGGDEFAVILTDATVQDAMATTERIAEAISTARAEICADIASTASIGWVTWNHGESAEDLITRADEALHEAKTESRELLQVSPV